MIRARASTLLPAAGDNLAVDDLIAVREDGKAPAAFGRLPAAGVRCLDQRLCVRGQLKGSRKVDRALRRRAGRPPAPLAALHPLRRSRELRVVVPSAFSSPSEGAYDH